MISISANESTSIIPSMIKETNCNITPFVQSNPRFDQNSMRQMPIPSWKNPQRYGWPVQGKEQQLGNRQQRNLLDHIGYTFSQDKIWRYVPICYKSRIV